MIKKIRINFVKGFVELNEKLVFNKRVIKFYKNELSQNLNSVIDVGVNTGQSIEIFRRINNRCSVIGFEPNPTLFQRIKNKYAGDQNIKLHQLGISNQKGTKVFHENVLHSTSSFEDLSFDSQYLAKKARVLGVKKENIINKSYEVEITTLNDYINSNCNTDIDILKIDTEGHEYYCLEGLFLGELKVNVKYIQIEERNDDMYLNKKTFKEIQGLLDKNGYGVEGKIQHGFGDFQEVIFKKR